MNETEPDDKRPAEAPQEPRARERAIPQSARHPGGIRRHFEGWQAGLVALWTGVITMSLVIARPAEPGAPPAPLPDRRLLAFEEGDQALLAARARQRPLAYDARATGELFRRYGKLAAEGRTEAAERVQHDLKVQARNVIAKSGDASLLELRALQCELFSKTLSEWEANGSASSDLTELGGNLLQKAKAAGWIQKDRLILNEVERAIFFRIRWSEVTGLREEAHFMPTQDDWRVYYGFLLRHPEAGSLDDPRGLSQALGYVRALAKHDPDYPAAFARGILGYRLGAFEAAVAEFRAALTADPDGPYTLRAKNYLLAALAQSPATE